MSREKGTVEERIEAAKACVEGRMSQSEAARRLGVDESSVRGWIARYKSGGVLAFKEQEHNTVYSGELKALAVREYLEGKGSLREISAKYGLLRGQIITNLLQILRLCGIFTLNLLGGV